MVIASLYHRVFPGLTVSRTIETVKENHVTAELKIEIWCPNKLVPYIRNPRVNDHAVDRMVASIQEFGFKIPILARSSGEVVDGHLRLKAARKLGIVEVPVILCDEWTEAQVKAFRLMVNRSVSWADWDSELVALEIQELKAMDFDLNLTGFDPVEVDEFLFAGDQNSLPEENIPELPREAVTQLGDRWRCAIGSCVAMPPRKKQFSFCLAPPSLYSWWWILRTG